MVETSSKTGTEIEHHAIEYILESRFGLLRSWMFENTKLSMKFS